MTADDHHQESSLTASDYRLIVETAAEGIWMIDCDARTTYVNENLSRMLGYPAAEMLGRNPLAFIPRHERGHAEESFERLSSGVGGQFEFVLERKDGSELFALVSGNPIYDGEGNFGGGLAMLADITERKLAERRLLAQHEVTRVLAESSSVAQATPRLLRAVCEATGWVLAQVWTPHGDLLRLDYGWYAEGYDGAFKRASREAAPARGEGLLGEVWERGEPVWIVDLEQEGRFQRSEPAAKDRLKTLLAFPIGARGEVRAVVELASAAKRPTDEAAFELLRAAQTQIEQFMKRTRAEERLRRSERRFRALFDSAGVGVVLIDPERRVVECNEAYAAVLGYPVDELVGVCLADLTYPEDEALSQELYGQLLAGEVSFTRFEKRFVRKDGEIAWVRMSGAPIAEPRADSEFVVAIAEDITERKELEEQLRQSQKMEAVGRLAGGVAHDFNNLLLAIGGYSELAGAELAASGDHETARQSLEQIAKATERAGSLTRQLLAFSRKQILVPRVVDLNRLIAEDETLLKGLVGEGVDLRFSFDRKPCNVKVDPGQLQQVIMNVVINARDAMPNGGELVITTKRRRLSTPRAQQEVVLEPGTYVELQIGDTGIGMNEETSARVFEPFFTTKPTGSGLGLSTAYGIVTQSGGQIEVDSRLWEGSTFRVLLPHATVEPEVERNDVASAVREMGSETILVVDDEAAVLDVVATMLERLGYDVVRAASAEECLRVEGEHAGAIDLLLTDIAMPEGNGDELAAAITRRRPEIAVLFMTGYADPEIVHAEVEDGGEMFLRKPFGTEELVRKVRSALAARPAPTRR